MLKTSVRVLLSVACYRQGGRLRCQPASGRARALLRLQSCTAASLIEFILIPSQLISGNSSITRANTYKSALRMKSDTCVRALVAVAMGVCADQFREVILLTSDSNGALRMNDA